MLFFLIYDYWICSSCFVFVPRKISYYFIIIFSMTMSCLRLKKKTLIYMIEPVLFAQFPVYNHCFLDVTTFVVFLSHIAKFISVGQHLLLLLRFVIMSPWCSCSEFARQTNLVSLFKCRLCGHVHNFLYPCIFFLYIFSFLIIFLSFLFAVITICIILILLWATWHYFRGC